MRRHLPTRFAIASVTLILALVVVGALHAEDRDDDRGPNFLPNGMLFPNSNGASSTISTTGKVDLTGPFFQSLGTNGRSCASCHLPGQGMSISAEDVQERFEATRGLDPIFRTNDGSNCDTNDVSTLEARRKAYSLLRTRGLIRVAIGVPAGADYAVTAVDNPYGCGSTSTISQYRRPLPSANLKFLSAVMWDGRESTGFMPDAITSRKLSNANDNSANNFAQLRADLAIQSVDATLGHAQGAQAPTAAQQNAIVNFEMALFTAQAVDEDAGRLNARGAKGGPSALVNQNFFISINSSVHPFDATRELPAGLNAPGDGIPFTPAIFDIFNAWSSLPSEDPRAAIARGQELFNSKKFSVSGVAGINDAAETGGIVPITGVDPLPDATCGTCHDTPNVGNHSFPTPLDIGTGAPDPGNPNRNLGGLNIKYLPTITVCKLNSVTHLPDPTNCKTTTDLGQALIDGKFDHVGKIKGPVLRSLSSRAPYFHNGSAQTLLDIVNFYNRRFNIGLTPGEKRDLVAFLASL